MRTTLDTRLVDPTAFEPGLVADVRDERRALLFDVGPDIEQLGVRLLLRVSHVFVTHTHMDHFAGFDTLLALGLGRLPRLALWGGPGFVDQLEHKLLAYTWNVVHRYETPMVLDVHSLELDGSHRHARFDSLEAFRRRDLPPDRAPDPSVTAPRASRLHEETLYRVRAILVDHEMPVMAYAIEEKAQVRVAADRIAAMGLATGAWLRTLKQAVLAGEADDTPIALAWMDARGAHTGCATVGELRPLVLDTVPGRRIGYVTDLRFTEDNVERLHALLADVDLLHVECVFAQAECDHARRKNHLTARQAGEIARRLGAKRVVPFHFSPRYRGREQELRDELEAARASPRALHG